NGWRTRPGSPPHPARATPSCLPLTGEERTGQDAVRDARRRVKAGQGICKEKNSAFREKKEGAARFPREIPVQCQARCCRRAAHGSKRCPCARGGGWRRGRFFAISRCPIRPDPPRQGVGAGEAPWRSVPCPSVHEQQVPCPGTRKSTWS